ncbi:MAG: cyclic nucleotide-binding domain-containing protein [Deltaproteobacteria bacterium]|nr:cyclic nucleotide-binding domain-containing protein [Deltaproteobacteria bacterium]
MISTSQLKEFAFFKGFSDPELEKLATVAKDETYDAGTQMYKNGDPARGLFLIQEGKVVLVMDSYLGPHKPPMQVTVDVVTKGESSGWSAVVEPYVYTLGALCIDRVKAIVLEAPGLRRLMDDDACLGYKVMKATAKVIANRLNHTRIILVGERGLSTLTEY